MNENNQSIDQNMKGINAMISARRISGSWQVSSILVLISKLSNFDLGKKS